MMESKYANLEKPVPRPRRTRSCIVILLVYNTLILTGAFFTMGFFMWHGHGTISYVWDSDQGSKASSIKDHMKMYDMRLANMEERVGINTEAGVEMIQTDYFGTEVVTYLDFKKSMGTFYIAGLDECYLVGGLDHRLIRPAELVRFLDDTYDHTLSPSEESLTYEKAADYPIVDNSLLPEVMKSDCADKSLYWLRQVDSKTAGSARHKRAAEETKNSHVVRVCMGLCMYVQTA